MEDSNNALVRLDKGPAASSHPIECAAPTVPAIRIDQATESALVRFRRRVPFVVQEPALLDWLSLEEVLDGLSRQLRTRVGKGYSARSLWYFRDFYVTYRGRTPSIRAEGFRTSLVQSWPKASPAASRGCTTVRCSQ